MTLSSLPAWSRAGAVPAPRPAGWPTALDRAWAFGDGRGAGVRVAVLDSGIEAGHPRVGHVVRSVVAEADAVRETAPLDVSGHGTACAGIVRSLAPDCELTSVRVLAADLTGGGRELVAGLRWAVEERFDVVNLSLSTTRKGFADELRDLADAAHFAGVLLVASAHNMPLESYPWRFAPVLSVASHDEPDGEAFFVNGSPPVEVHARGVDVEVAWRDGASVVATGNSFAAPHVSGMAARVLGAHPGWRPALVRTALALAAGRAGRAAA